MARGCFTPFNIEVDYWLRNTPPGGPLRGDIALLGSAPSGGWASFGAGDLLRYDGASWRLNTIANGLRGGNLWNKDGSSADTGKYFGHDGTVLIGPLLVATSYEASAIIAAQEFGGL
jgi:hypothetical protein